MDSGAFSTWKSGHVITLDQYCTFLDRLPRRPWRYFLLDVIGDPDGTRRNYETMLARGYHPVPIVTRGGPAVFDAMDRYYETSDLVAVGGMAQGNVRPEPFVKAIMQHAAGRRVHLLGFTNWNWLKHIRPYMADSSSWTSAARYGQIVFYLGHGNFLRLHKKDFASNPPPANAIAMARSMGFEPYGLADDANWIGNDSLSNWITAASWFRASLDMEPQLHTKMFISLAINRPDFIVAAYRIARGELAGEAARQVARNRKR